jgi:hypothetical protein
MIPVLFQTKSFFAPVSTTNGGTASGYIDTRGARYLVAQVSASTSNNATNKYSVLKLMEADTTDATAFANVSGAVGGTDFTIPNAVTTGVWDFQFRVDLRKRKRYLQVVASPVTTVVTGAVGALLHAEVAGVNATELGVAGVVEL